MTTKVNENGKTNGDAPINFTAWITEELENAEDEKVLPARITKYLENTNQDDYVISEGETKKDLPALIIEDLENKNQDDDVISEGETKKDLPAQITKNLENTNQDDYVISDDKTKKDLTAWMRGYLENMDQDDYFVSEDESERRILLILKTLSALLLLVCSILAAKCFDYSSFSVKRRIIHSSNGKYSRM